MYERVSFSLFLVLMQKVLFVLKRIEFQMNTQFQSVQQVMRELRILIVIERVFLLTYICVIAFLMIYDIKDMLNSNDSEIDTPI